VGAGVGDGEGDRPPILIGLPSIAPVVPLVVELPIVKGTFVAMSICPEIEPVVPRASMLLPPPVTRTEFPSSETLPPMLPLFARVSMDSIVTFPVWLVI
jgi:hypothetical protein